MSSTKPLIAFFGATGGCALNALTYTLKAGFPAIALARTPAKLIKCLTESQKISESVVSSQLQIIEGSSTDIIAVKSLLEHNPSVIISGLGPVPKIRASITSPIYADQPHICSDSAKLLIQALHELEEEQKLTTKPFLSVISTTGIGPTRDVPTPLVPLYNYALRVPHEDKKMMEDAGVGEVLNADPVLSGFVTVRASLLTNGHAKGKGNVKTGWVKHPSDLEGQNGPGPAIGYTISRADVGLWCFEKLIDGESTEWNRRLVTVTY